MDSQGGETVKKFVRVKNKIVTGLTYVASLVIFFAWMAFLILLPIGTSIMLGKWIAAMIGG